jgi:ligand-binding sensor domain-containing protein
MNSLYGRNTVAILLLLVAGGELWAQADQRIRSSNRHYRRGDWISQSTTRFVRDLAIGPNEVYFATTGGITRFNHYNRQWQEPYTVSDGLPVNEVRLVAFDAATGFLWCATAAGISYLEPASLLWQNFYYDEMGFHPGETAQSLGFSDDRRVLLVTDRSRWFASSNSSGFFSSIAPIAGDAGIRWHGRQAKPEPPPPYLFLPDGLMYNEEKKSISDTHLRTFQVTCWARDEWQTLWLGTWGLGAGRADLNTSRLDMLPHGLWSPVVMAMDSDEEAIWLGGVQSEKAGPAGITRWIDESSAPEYLEPRFITGFYEDRITAIAADRQAVWFGTLNGLTRHDKKRNIFRTFFQTDHLSDPRITDLVLTENKLWVGTEAGLSCISQSVKGKKDSFSVEVIDFKNTGTTPINDLALHENLLWAATEYGLYRYDLVDRSGEFYQGPLGPGTQATFAVVCWGPEVWYATDRGISALVEDEAIFDQWPLRSLRNEPVTGRINRLAADDRSLWAAGEDGVLRLDRNENRWIHYTVEDGLPDNRVLCILTGGDYVWFGSVSGLTRFFWNAPYRID